MSTVGNEFTSGDGWKKVAEEDEDYLLENRGRYTVFVTQQSSVPSSSTPYHVLQPTQAMVRIGGGALYVSTDYEGYVVVTT